VLLGAKWRDKVRAYASTLFRPSPSAICDAVKHYLDEGFTAVKFGWGVFGKDRKLDLHLVEAARRELGDDKDLMVDTGWFVERTPKEALRLAGELEQFQPFFLEEMLHPEDYDGYRQLAEGSAVNIACGEQEATEWGFQQLLERGKVDVLQPDLTRCGGFTVGRKIVHMAERANRLVIPHSWCSDLLTAASLHLNAFQRRGVYIEFNTSHGPLSRELVKNPLKLDEGYVKVPEGPGLGVEVNEETISKYRIA
jgi:L-alanine-DL-glutamate epimerase-like enolase superfamily enzyme